MRDPGERALPRDEHGIAGSQEDRSAWRGGRRRAACAPGKLVTRHGCRRARSATAQPLMLYGETTPIFAACGAWTTMTRVFLSRWTIEPD